MSTFIMNESFGEKCVICDCLKPKGIHLYTSFICIDCERQIIATNTNDPKYKLFLSKLKKINKPEIYS